MTKRRVAAARQGVVAAAVLVAMLAACSDDDFASPMTALPVPTAGATSEPASTDAATVPETAASTTPEVT